MRIKNYTNLSKDQIRGVIQFVKPNNLPTSNFDVRITNTCYTYCGVFYEKGGYAKKGVGSDPNRPLVIARVAAEEGDFPLREDNSPRRRVDLYYEKYDERKGIWKTWHSWRYLGISKVYTARRNKENRDKGKLCDWKKRTGGYIESLILSREEALVHVLAHELRHLWQVNHTGRRGKVWGARGKYSDRDADAYAIRKQRAYRKLYYPKDIIQIGKLNWNLIENDIREYNPNIISSESIDCHICRSMVIAEYNAELDLINLYDFDPYYHNNQKITYRHHADTITRNRVLERIRVEKRLLDDVDPNDYYYNPMGGINNVR